MTCDAKIRPFWNEIEVACEEEGEHKTHAGLLRDYAYPGSSTRIEFMEEDRRTYHGDWPGACGKSNCSLPKGHRGKHVE